MRRSLTKAWVVVLLLAGIGALSACHTIDGAGQDLKQAANAIGNAF